jgi:hypothetical protein
MYRETRRPVGLGIVDGDFFADTLVLVVSACVSARRGAGVAIIVCLQVCWGAVVLLAFARFELVLVAADGEVLCWFAQSFCLVVPRGEIGLSPSSGLYGARNPPERGFGLG